MTDSIYGKLPSFGQISVEFYNMPRKLLVCYSCYLFIFLLHRGVTKIKKVIQFAQKDVLLFSTFLDGYSIISCVCLLGYMKLVHQGLG